MLKAFGMRRDRHSWPALLPQVCCRTGTSHACSKTSAVNVSVRELELELDFIWNPVAFYQTEDHGIVESSCFRPAVVKSSILC